MNMLPANHPTVKPPKTGVLLLNLGTPDGCDTRSVRRYLAEFLSDKRVISAPRWLWLPLLHGIILNTRPRKSAHAYSAIWNREQNESPLKTITRAQAEALAARFANSPDVMVTWGMRYGNPSTKHALQSLLDAGCTRVLAIALYPQYSATTTASAYDKLFSVAQTLTRQPAIRTAPAYHDDPLYISALAASVREALSLKQDRPGRHEVSEGESHSEREQRDTLPVSEANHAHLHYICSFHGLPKKYFEAGDPYHCYCQKTSRLLREQLGIPKEQWHTSFQSRFGPTEWLKPYTQTTIEDLAKAGTKHIVVISPGFASDCIETLEELNMGLRETFMEHGGESFTYIPCLNASDAHITLLESLARRELSGW